MLRKLDPSRGRERGQILVIAVFAMIGMIAMAGVIVDGGNAFAHQRQTQNGADAAALAGTGQVLSHLAGVTSVTDATIASATQTAADANGVKLDHAWYVNFGLNVIGDVGNGSIPIGASGVKTQVSMDVSTFFAPVVGVSSFTTGASATARAGKMTGTDLGLPLTFAVNIEYCDGSGKLVTIGSSYWPVVTPETADSSNEVVLPLCKNGPGGFGWLDLGCGTLKSTVQDGCNTIFELPNAWIQSQAGDDNGVQSQITQYYGSVLTLPLFDATCKVVPDSGLPTDCPKGASGGNTWYHVPTVIGFLLDHAYIQGDNSGICNSPPGINPAGGMGETGCLKGWLVWQVSSGTVVSCVNPDGVPNCIGSLGKLGIQLVQ